jgi:S-disulfanyl-L-cysteine oxidoreductase SoxD
MSMSKRLALALLLGSALAAGPALAQLGGAAAPNLGQKITPEEIKPWDISILPDGTNLPPGSGTSDKGAKLFVEKGCVACHGEGGKGASSTQLVGSPPITGIESLKTIANFWREPTTLFDYIRRAMPWPTPHTLKDEEVYSLVAYLLAANKLIPEDQVMDAKSLPQVEMPNRDNFIIKFPDRI